MKRYVESKVSFEGIHCWPDAPQEVYFLRTSHRHIFTVIARKEVFHNDRDVEFIMMGRAIKSHIIAKYPAQVAPAICGALELGHTSCEMIAEDLIETFDLCECAVYEDMENGGILKKD